MFSDNITKFYIDHTFFDFHHIESTCLWFQSLFWVAFWLLISKVTNLHSWCRQLLLGTLDGARSYGRAPPPQTPLPAEKAAPGSVFWLRKQAQQIVESGFIYFYLYIFFIYFYIFIIFFFVKMKQCIRDVFAKGNTTGIFRWIQLVVPQ